MKQIKKLLKEFAQTVLVIIVSINAIKKCLYLVKTVPASYDTTETVEAEEIKQLDQLVAQQDDEGARARRFKELTISNH